MTSSPIDCLRKALAILRHDGSAEVVFVADRIEKYIAGARNGERLDTALGLAPLPGATPWWEIEARAERDAVLKMLRDRHFPNLLLSEAAREISAIALRRQSRGFGPPANDREKLVDAALRTGLPVPGPRQLSKILRNELAAFNS